MLINNTCILANRRLAQMMLFLGAMTTYQHSPCPPLQTCTCILEDAPFFDQIVKMDYHTMLLPTTAYQKINYVSDMIIICMTTSRVLTLEENSVLH